MIDNKVEAIKVHVEEIMRLLDIKKDNSNENTPLRISKMWVNELFRNRNGYHIEELNASMKTFDWVEKDDNFIIVKGVDFHSMCEHHWLPFTGKADVAYVPDGKIIGLSKIPRIVEYFSKRPQVQERLVKDIGEYLFKTMIDPKAVVVRMQATHDCVMCRGIESKCVTDTLFHKFGKLVTSSEQQNYLNDFHRRLNTSRWCADEEAKGDR